MRCREVTNGGYYRSALIFMLSAFFAVHSYGQERIQWISWEEAVTLSQESPRKIIVDVYTDWCGWCKKMDKVTFQNPEVAQYVNEHYYAIKFNAEQREAIKLKDEVYEYVKQGPRGYHELAAEITFGRLSFPTIVFLNEKLEIIQPIPGFKNHEDFQMIMHYFSNDYHKTTPWKKFAASYSRNP